MASDAPATPDIASPLKKRQRAWEWLLGDERGRLVKASRTAVSNAV